ncbi:beta-hexosaminidase [Filimonas sp.]|nr:beta-hexosaminidase [Filimonas sp.]
MKKVIYMVVSQLVFFTLLSQAQSIIPCPQSQSEQENKTEDVKMSDIRFISADSKALEADCKVFAEYLTKMGYQPIEQKESATNAIHLITDTEMQDEEYRMKCKANQVVEIRGGKAGVFYGLMSMLQLIQEGHLQVGLSIPELHDFPAYSWRGMHLDVCRHFFPKEFVKKYIDILALHKMNTFHWHLTDDQGWRIEIKKYPKLTEIGSKRKESIVEKNFDPYIGDGIPVEGFYTQEDIKEVVAYAQGRHVTVVPEIEMPGHAQAALSAYPQYSCRKQPLEPLTKWGVSYDVFCTDDATIRFLEDILDEVMALFPSKYIHIGGDEVPKDRWKECPVCQQTMKKNQLKDENELQSYFIKKIDTYVTSKGRNIIGWDEILEGGLAPNAAVMSWRGEEGGISAAKQKHKVVMTPGSHCYFDHYQGNRITEPLSIGGFTPIQKVYSYQPTPLVLSFEEKKYILGAQANVWTEYIATTDHVEYMAVPRLCALAEVLWSGGAKSGWQDFKGRLHTHFDFLTKFDIHYASSIFDVAATRKIVDDEVEVTLESEYEEGNIQYQSLDGIKPQLLLYKKGHPLVFKKSGKLRAAYFEGTKDSGHMLEEEIVVHKALGKKISSSAEPGSSYNEGGLPKLLDSKAGHAPRLSSEWLGWSGKSPEIVIDLGKASKLNTLDVYTLKEEINWIYLPIKIEVALSADGLSYQTIKTMTVEEIANAYGPDNKLTIALNNTKARFVKLSLNCAPKIAKGKAGEGEDAWLFLSELVVN